MAIVKRNEFLQMNEPQLKERLNELRKEMIKINAQLSTHTPPENPGRVRTVKKTIARIYTRLSQFKKLKPKEVKQTK